jgi:hypothetical protein
MSGALLEIPELRLVDARPRLERTAFDLTIAEESPVAVGAARRGTMMPTSKLQTPQKNRIGESYERERERGQPGVAALIRAIGAERAVCRVCVCGQG